MPTDTIARLSTRAGNLKTRAQIPVNAPLFAILAAIDSGLTYKEVAAKLEIPRELVSQAARLAGRDSCPPQPASARTQVLALFTTHPEGLTRESILPLLPNIPPRTVSFTLHSLVYSGRLSRSPDGHYTLA